VWTADLTGRTPLPGDASSVIVVSRSRVSEVTCSQDTEPSSLVGLSRSVRISSLTLPHQTPSTYGDALMYQRPPVPRRTPRAEAFAARMAEAMRSRVLSFPLTAFSADGSSFAEAAFRAHLRGRVAADAGAVFVACGAGEFSALDELEFRRVL